jgi:serine acetyltransferase
MIGSESSIFSKIKRFVENAREHGIQTAVNQTVLYFELRVIPQSSCVIGQVLPPSTTLHHPTGIVIAGDAEIGENVHIYQNVTIGNKNGGYPTIGDNVRICAGAAIIGDVHIGDNATVGANAVVLDDVEENTTVAGVPAKKISTSD